MPVFPACRWLTLCLLVCAAPAHAYAQSEARIWGEVTTAEGDRYEGFIRWDRNEGGWADLLDGSKEIPEEAYEDWLQALRGGERPTRSIDLMGYRITWNEEDPDFPSEVLSGIRFGHVAGLTVVNDDRVALTLQSGEWLELFGGSTDIGWSIRDVVVEDPDRGLIELDWDELDRIVFAAAPPGARPESSRLYGTVEDASGRTFSGYISWDLDEILQTDVLDGEDEDNDDHEIEFGDIRSIAQTEDATSRVTLTTGEVLLLSGTNDVEDGHRGVQISDPDLGMVEVEWEEFVAIRFESPPPGNGYATYDGGHQLVGTVVTEGGDEIYGRVRWDSDEQWSWELLNGRSEWVRFVIEFGKIDSIERSDSTGATVTLLDGRSFLLEGSNDVDENNKGVFVQQFPGDVGSSRTDQAAEENDRGWRYVPWEDFRAVRFDHPMPADRQGDGAAADQQGDQGAASSEPRP